MPDAPTDPQQVFHTTLPAGTSLLVIDGKYYGITEYASE